MCLAASWALLQSSLCHVPWLCFLIAVTEPAPPQIASAAAAAPLTPLTLSTPSVMATATATPPQPSLALVSVYVCHTCNSSAVHKRLLCQSFSFTSDGSGNTDSTTAVVSVGESGMIVVLLAAQSSSSARACHCNLSCSARAWYYTALRQSACSPRSSSPKTFLFRTAACDALFRLQMRVL